MARYTIREFTERVGLGKDRDSVTRSGIILKALCGLGIAKEVGKKHGANGRPAVLYEVPDTIVIPVTKPPTAESSSAKEVVAVVAPEKKPVTAPAVPSAPAGNFNYDDDEDED